MRTVFMGSPDFAVESLKALTASPRVDLLGAVTQPDRPRGRGMLVQPSPVKEYALSQGLTVWQPERVSNKDFVELLGRLRPDLIVVVAYGQKIPPSILSLPPKGCLNVHGSILPRYRGAAPIHRAIMDGCSLTGVTTMYMDEGWDTGDIILTRELTIGPEETVGSLHDRMALAGGSLLAETIEAIAMGTAPRIPQDHSRATYAPKIAPEETCIDWTKSAEAIFNQVRGMNPWPVANTLWHGSGLRVWGAKVWTGELTGNFPPGSIVELIKGLGVLVQAGAGALVLTEVQPSGRNRMPAEAFWQGYGLASGCMFGERAI